MDIKQFQKGQSAYMLKETHGYSKPPDSHEQNSKYFVQEFPHTGRKGFSNHAMICSFIVMKCEGFSMVSDLVDYLYNNLLIAHYCGFDIFRPLPSYWTFNRFLKNFDNGLLPIYAFWQAAARQEIYMEFFKNLPGTGERSACDLLHLRL